MTEILVLEKPEEKLRRERERLLGELSVYGERLAVLQGTVDEIKEMIECYDEAIENLEIEQAEQNSKTLEEELVYMGEGFVGSKKIETAGQYSDEIYFNREDLLRRLSYDGYLYLARDKNGVLSVHKGSPIKVEEMDTWNFYTVTYSETIQNDNFPEVKWTDEEPTSISNLLETYENGGENGKW